MKITPNQITWVRIILIPVIIFFYMASSFIYCGKLVAAGIFAFACLTDFLDGYIARKYNMITNLGKFLDSIADKLLVVCGFILIVADGTIINPYGVIAFSIIVAREFIVSALRQIGAVKNIVIQADMWGKVKANFQFFAVLFFMVYSFFLDNNKILLSQVDLSFFILCYLLLAVTVLATVISGIHYLISFKEVFKDDKKASSNLKDQQMQEALARQNNNNVQPEEKPLSKNVENQEPKIESKNAIKKINEEDKKQVKQKNNKTGNEDKNIKSNNKSKK